MCYTRRRYKERCSYVSILHYIETVPSFFVFQFLSKIQSPRCTIFFAQRRLATTGREGILQSQGCICIVELLYIYDWPLDSVSVKLNGSLLDCPNILHWKILIPRITCFLLIFYTILYVFIVWLHSQYRKGLLCLLHSPCRCRLVVTKNTPKDEFFFISLKQSTCKNL